MTDADFQKFREKKLNEKAAEKHEDDDAFFGTFKKKPEEEDGPKKMKLSDLNLPDERPDNVPKVGESLKLIDIALEKTPQKGGPPRPAPPQRPTGARPAAPPTGRPAPKPGAPAPRPGQPPRPTGAVPQAPRPGAPPTGRPLAPGTQRPTGAQPKLPPRPAAAPPRPAAPPKPLPGFKDRAHESEGSISPVKHDHFEDTTFVEATDHADPYEFRDHGRAAGLELGDTADEAARPRAPGPPPASRPGGASKSGKNKAVKPPSPPPPPKKTNTRSVKRGPLGR